MEVTNKLQQLINRHKKTRMDVAAACKVSTQAVDMWAAQTSQPNGRYLPIIFELFEITILDEFFKVHKTSK